MKNGFLALAFLLILTAQPTQAQSNFLSPLSNTLSNLIPKQSGSQDPGKPEDQIDISQAHGIHDLNCEQGLVDPFELTTNFSKVLQAGATGALSGVVGSLFGRQASAANATDTALKTAKLAARNMNWLPMSLERQMGERLHAEEADLIDPASTKAIDRDYYATANRLLAQLKDGISTPHPYEFQLFVLNRTTTNAKAIPGGYLYIDRGALPTRRDPPKEKSFKENAALFTLAHEMAHVLKRHETRETQNRIIDTVDTFEKMKDIFQAAGPNPQLAFGAVGYLKKLHESYSPDQEKQADACAIRLIAGIKGPVAKQAFTAFVNTLPAYDPSDIRHPAAQDRILHGHRILLALNL